jgi:hypothetical protein
LRETPSRIKELSMFAIIMNRLLEHRKTSNYSKTNREKAHKEDWE